MIDANDFGTHREVPPEILELRAEQVKEEQSTEVIREEVKSAMEAAELAAQIKEAMDKPTLLEVAKSADEPQKIPLTEKQSASLDKGMRKLSDLTLEIEKVKFGLQMLMEHMSSELRIPEGKKFNLSPDRTRLIEVKE